MAPVDWAHPGLAVAMMARNAMMAVPYFTPLMTHSSCMWPHKQKGPAAPPSFGAATGHYYEKTRLIGISDHAFLGKACTFSSFLDPRIPSASSLCLPLLSLYLPAISC